MNSRIANKFAKLRQQGKAALVTYIMAFDPDRKTYKNILELLPSSGADIIELGMPFTDPVAEGPIIQCAAARALEAGSKLGLILEDVANFRRADNETPIILMGYYNVVLHYGVEKFVVDAKKSGVDGVLIVDLPIEEDQELFEVSRGNNFSNIKLITPTTSDDRIDKIIEKSNGFIYYVAVAGVTGSKSATVESIERAIANIKKRTDIPVAVGFGIKNRQNVEDCSKVADAVVVGSALVKTIAESPNPADYAADFVRSLKN